MPPAFEKPWTTPGGAATKLPRLDAIGVRPARDARRAACRGRADEAVYEREGYAGALREANSDTYGSW